MGSYTAADPAGRTAVPGVWVAGNATDLSAQVSAASAAVPASRRRSTPISSTRTPTVLSPVRAGRGGPVTHEFDKGAPARPARARPTRRHHQPGPAARDQAEQHGGDAGTP